MSMVASSIMSGALTQRSGYYVPSMLLCSCFMSVGQGLLTTLKPSTGSSQWIAYQFLVGFGVGFGIQTASLAVQTTLPKPDIPTGIAITFFAQQLGGAIFTSVGQTILSDLLVRKLNRIPGINSATIVESGATELQRLVPERFQGAVINAYNDACTRIFVVAAALSCIQLLCALAMEWKSIKKGKQGTNNPEPGLIENQKGSQ
jgi:MFS family permease